MGIRKKTVFLILISSVRPAVALDGGFDVFFQVLWMSDEPAQQRITSIELARRAVRLVDLPARGEDERDAGTPRTFNQRDPLLTGLAARNLVQNQ